METIPSPAVGSFAATEAARVRAYRGEQIEMPAGGFLTRIRSKYGAYHWVRSYSTRITDAEDTAIGLAACLEVFLRAFRPVSVYR